MLETENGLRVKALFLGQVHPSRPKVRLIRIPCMEDEINLIVADQLARGETVSEALPGVDAPFTLPGQTNLSDVFVCACTLACPHVCACPVDSPLSYFVHGAREMKASKTSSVVLIERLPYPAWRLLIDYFWRDFAFTYYVVPRFRDDCSIAVDLLTNGGPRYQAPSYPEAGPCGEAQDDAGHGSRPAREEAISQRRELGSRIVARFRLRDQRRENIAGAAHVVVYRECDSR